MSKSISPDTIFGHYRIVSRIGAGGMGEVWLAEDTRLGRKVALKLLPAEFTEDSDRVRRFTLEAKAASGLNHPNIISVYDIGECDAGRFIVMEFVAGRTLRSVIAKDNSLDTLFTLGAQMARGLSAAHAAGITHRDIKPDNIMVRDDGYVKMLDFGLARLLPTTSSDPEAATMAQQTTPGTVMGTLAYMSPEQASGQTVGSASDVFSLGIVLYELATGSHPFKSETMIGYLHAITLQVPPALTSLKSHLPSALDDLILRMLEKDAVSRPTAAEVVQALQEIEKYGSSNTLPLRIVGDKLKAAREEALYVSGEKRADEGFWVAVLPFKATGTNAELSTLAEGLSDEIVTGLNRFSYLRVIARSSTLRYSSQTSDVRSVGKALGARYVMEGNVRQAGSVIRVTAQLVDASTGAHLWAETYDRPFQPDEIFALQDDLVPRIVSTVADQHGVLPHTMSEAVRVQDPDQLTAYETLLRGFRYYEGISANEHATIRAALERALETSPGNADCWAMLAIMYCDEHKFGFNQLPDSLGRALNAAQRAVEISPTNPFAYEALAQALFFRKEFDSFRNAAERAIALNPMDGATNAFMGILIAFTGDWDYGCTVAERATQLNPHHPGWYWNAAFYNAYRKRDYESALKITLEFNMPGLFYHHVNRAAVYGQLGDLEAAGKSLGELLALKPDFAGTARQELGKWLRQEFVEHVIEGLRKAGLEIGGDEASPITSSTPAVSSLSRADEGFWIAVLPFKFTGSNTEVSTLAEGLSEEIVTGLSRFSYLRVISRSSTLRYAHETDDVRTVGKTLGARYVMEGSLRVAGASLRVSVQLIDASTGAHLWAETYDRQFRAEEIFALQDDLVPRIVSTVADVNGVLPRSMSEIVCAKNPAELSPYEAVLRSFRYFDRVNAEELAAAQSCLEIAVKKAPTNADAWAMLALLFVQDYGQGFNLHPDALDSGTMAAQRAVEAGPSNHLAYFSLAQARFFQKDIQSFRNAAERTVALNPMDANSLAFVGELFTYVGDYERGLALAAHAKAINPNHPGWFWYADYFYAYRQGDYRSALSLILKANLPGHWGMHAGIAAAAGQLGDHETASKAVRDLLKLRPDYGTTVRDTLAKWFDPELGEQLLDGLRKAGLEIAADKGTTSSTANSETTSAIAVLPFQNLSGDSEQEYFADGITEEILNALAQIPGLRVAGRSSAFSFKGRNEDLRAVGAKLGVGTILEGTLRRSGDRLRITVQLIDAGNGYQIWSERYDRVIADVFAVQDEIANTIAGRLQLSLNASAEIQPPPTRHIGAYELYLKGRSLLYQRGLSIPKAIDCFTRAVAFDPLYAQAWAGLADGFTTSGYSGFKPAIEVMPKALEAARRALELDESLAEAHNALACATLLYDRNYELAERQFLHALELNPNYPQARAWYGLFFLDWAASRLSEGRDEMFRLLRIDPLSAYANVIFCLSYASNDRTSEAVEHGRRGVELDPGSYLAQWSLAVALEGDAQHEEASVLAERALALSGRHCWALTTLASIYAGWNKHDDARAVYGELEARRTREYIQPSMLAISASAVGEMDQALAYAQQALNEKDPLFVMLARSWPQYKKLRTDPRFLEVVRELRFPNWNPEGAL